MAQDDDATAFLGAAKPAASSTPATPAASGTPATPHPPHTPRSPTGAAAPHSGDGWVLGGRYRVIERIGVGGMADVVRAHDELLARDVAVKVFRTRPATPDSASDAERQKLELRALARLNHPNLITLYDASIAGSDGPAFLVMELITGPTLAARLEESLLPEAQVREIGTQLADGLAYVHAHGLVHRDVKPANILLGGGTGSGNDPVRARLSDFGIVRLLDTDRLTSVDMTLGTAAYLSPEQARGVDVGPVSDVYSLGLVLIEALSGVRPFDGPALQTMMDRLSRAPEIPPGLPEPWPGLLAAMTARDPAERPSAERVAQTLRGARPAPTVPTPVPAVPAGVATAVVPAIAPLTADQPPRPRVLPPPVLPPRAPARRRPAFAWLVAAAVIVVAIGISVLLLNLSSGDGNSPTSTSPTTQPASASATSTRPQVGVNSTSSAAPTTAASHSVSKSASTAPSSSTTTSTSAPPSTSASTSTSTSASSTAPSTAATSSTASGSTTSAQAQGGSTSAPATPSTGGSSR